MKNNGIPCIVLWGKGNCGKSTTLNLLIRKLLNDGAVRLAGNVAPTPEDSWAVLRYHNAIGIKTLGIITAGDSGSSLEFYLNKVEEAGRSCDAYICASRTRGSSCRYLKERFGNRILWQEKWSVSGENIAALGLSKLQNKANYAQVNGIMAMLDMI